MPFDCDFESTLLKYKNLSACTTPVFFCRYIFTGTSLIEVKDNLNVNAVMTSLTNRNSSVNNFISHNEKTAASDMTHVKSRYMNLCMVGIIYDFLTSNYVILIFNPLILKPP